MMLPPFAVPQASMAADSASAQLRESAIVLAQVPAQAPAIDPQAGKPLPEGPPPKGAQPQPKGSQSAQPPAAAGGPPPGAPPPKPGVYSQQSKSPNPPQPRAAVRDPYCPGNDNPVLMCRLVNQYRAKYGLRPVQLDGAVTREAQYWSDQLNLQKACWFLYHDYNYDARMRARFPGRRFRENAACSGSTRGGAEFVLQKWIDSAGHRQNMLTPEWTTIGVGVTNNIWVINFTN
jgi:uncharacterized protein YkwD